MNIDTLLTALVGAFFGAAGWLLVGIYMQRGRQTARRATLLERCTSSWP